MWNLTKILGFKPGLGQKATRGAFGHATLTPISGGLLVYNMFKCVESAQAGFVGTALFNNERNAHASTRSAKNLPGALDLLRIKFATGRTAKTHGSATDTEHQ
ncbi:hypothetical protein BJP34_02480 [Moorena producens PAL-8-15-08-1]|uniref:Uncharacterized protein n=1 Tax=Moorena producens PAL-8-15-08-1 TaxID=1458985 RepID=A0A1D8TLL0_9CYAN|nr:hypothetical protein BJP34_02480 [Moorena producens PAL-8-15-08-1]